MTSRSWGQAATLLLCLPAMSWAQGVPAGNSPQQENYGLRLEYREYRPTLSGEIQKGSGGTAGTLLDPKTDLGIEDERTFEVRASLQFRPGHKLRASYTRLDYDGDLESRRGFTFGATRYERFDRVVSSMKGAYYSAFYEWDLVRSPYGYLGALIGAKALDVDWLIVVPQLKRENDTLRAPLPVIGATARGYAGRFSVEGEISGLSIGNRGRLYEVETSARFHVSDRLAIQGGYRLLSIRAEDGLDLGRVRMSGLQFGVELSL